MAGAWRTRGMDMLKRPSFPIRAGIIGAGLASPALLSGFLVDDYWHRANFLRPSVLAPHLSSPLDMFVFADGNPATQRALMEIGILPWWTFEELRLAFFRPFTALTHALDYALWPNNAVLMHLHSLAWFFAVIVVAGFLYRRLMGPGIVAGFAILLYAIDDSHAMPAGWLANRNGLIAAFFGFSALLLHDRWRRGGHKTSGVLAVAALGLGLLSNEGALAACGYLFAYAMFLDPQPRIISRWATLAPYAAVAGIWRAYYSLNGYGAHGSATYIDPLSSPLAFVEAAAFRAPVLLLGQWAAPPSDIFIFLPRAVQLGVWAMAIAFCLALARVLWPMIREDARARFWAMGMVLALVPVCATFPMDRLLLFSGLGAMALLAMLIARIYQQRQSGDPALTRRLSAFATLLVVVHVVAAPLLLPLRIVAFTTASNVLTEAVDNGPASESVAGKTMVVVNAPNIGLTAYFYVIRALKGGALPAAMRNLAPNTGLPTPVHVRRSAPRTLEVSTNNGFQWILMRNDAHPFEVGDKVQLSGMTVEVLSLAPEGWPKSVAYHFDVPLDDTSLLWYQIRDWRYEPYVPPAIGEVQVLSNSP
jgi:hypothetical protein